MLPREAQRQVQTSGHEAAFPHVYSSSAGHLNDKASLGKRAGNEVRWWVRTQEGAIPSPEMKLLWAEAVACSVPADSEGVSPSPAFHGMQDGLWGREGEARASCSPWSRSGGPGRSSPQECSRPIFCCGQPGSLSLRPGWDSRPEGRFHASRKASAPTALPIGLSPSKQAPGTVHHPVGQHKPHKNVSLAEGLARH